MLGLRSCHGPGCGAIFFICVRCDRGQRYCSGPCRTATRRRQTQAANARHQRSEAGRQAHRARQKAYRAKLARCHVTNQGTTSVTTPRLHRPISPPTCTVCGHQTAWVNPFAPLPFRLRRTTRAHRSKSSGVGHFLRFLMAVNTCEHAKCKCQFEIAIEHKNTIDILGIKVNRLQMIEIDLSCEQRCQWSNLLPYRSNIYR